MFAKMARRAVRLTHRTTLCVSDQGRCKRVSGLLASVPRDGGIGPDGPLIVDGVDTIDLSAVGNRCGSRFNQVGNLWPALLCEWHSANSALSWRCVALGERTAVLRLIIERRPLMAGSETAIKVGARRASRRSDQLAAGGHAHYLDDAVSAHGDQAVDHVYDNTDMIGDHTHDVSDFRPIIAGR